MPVSSATKDWNGNDSLRRDLNDAWRAAAASGQVLMDFDAIAADTLDGDGQMLPKAGFLKDGIHPGDAGMRCSCRW